ncbi:MAG: hypothetical protein ABWW69_03840 [Pyrodictiaceae archaeon]
MSSRLQEFVKALEDGSIGIDEVEEAAGNPNLASLVRRLSLEKVSGQPLTAIASSILDFTAIGR